MIPLIRAIEIGDAVKILPLPIRIAGLAGDICGWKILHRLVVVPPIA